MQCRDLLFIPGLLLGDQRVVAILHRLGLRLALVILIPDGVGSRKVHQGLLLAGQQIHALGIGGIVRRQRGCRRLLDAVQHRLLARRLRRCSSPGPGRRGGCSGCFLLLFHLIQRAGEDRSRLGCQRADGLAHGRLAKTVAHALGEASHIAASLLGG